MSFVCCPGSFICLFLRRSHYVSLTGSSDPEQTENSEVVGDLDRRIREIEDDIQVSHSTVKLLVSIYNRLYI